MNTNIISFTGNHVSQNIFSGGELVINCSDDYQDVTERGHKVANIRFEKEGHCPDENCLLFRQLPVNEILKNQVHRRFENRIISEKYGEGKILNVTEQDEGTYR